MSGRITASAAPRICGASRTIISSAPAAAVDALAGHFSAAQMQRHVVAPAELGVKKIEHFGPFRRDLGANLWPRLLAPTEAATPLLAARLPCA